MYHRYMPSGNGQYRRQDVPERKPAPPSAPTPPQGPPPSVPPPPPPMPAPLSPPKSEISKSQPQNTAVPYPVPFLEKLFPGTDSGDLLLLLIMLLLLSEGTEDSVSVVMTLAIFLILQ